MLGLTGIFRCGHSIPSVATPIQALLLWPQEFLIGSLPSSQASGNSDLKLRGWQIAIQVDPCPIPFILSHWQGISPGS